MARLARGYPTSTLLRPPRRFPATLAPGTDAVVDDFLGGSLSATLWSASYGATVDGLGRASIAAAVDGNGGTLYAAARTAGTYAFTSLIVRLWAMPQAPGDTVNAQVWVMDSQPDASVARLGFEYVGAANRLDLLGQSGSSYAPIGTTASLAYSPTAHRWLRIATDGTTIRWWTAPDGVAWVLQRTLDVALPAWTTKSTLQVSLEAFRSSGVSDALLVDGVNTSPGPLDGRTGGFFL